jgi:hypothetical protein
MLKVRPPFLCHQCHTPHGGVIPQVRGQPGAITNISSGKSAINLTQARGCENCHTQIHGSNNPDVRITSPSKVTNPTPQFLLR